ncbi:MAG: cobalamin biosynthesis protein CobW [Clostridia bacterium]|nr:cobalamin biosynthesis protein CobW [Clostridia bacterium]
MTKIDIFSGFLGAGKTTLIKKLLKEAYAGEKLVLIENEFGEIGIDGGFMQDAGIEVTEMNSGCICCSLVGDFGKALQKVLDEYHPDRILIEPSGVGKLSDIIRAVQNLDAKDVLLNGFTTVADVKKCKMYMKNFGEFFNDQIENAGCIVLSHTQNASEEKIAETVALLREKNPTATIVTTPWDILDGVQLLAAMERRDTIEEELARLAADVHHHHHHEEECDDPDCHCHHHHHDEECHHEHHHHDEECDDPDCECHHHHLDEHEHEHEHHHHHHHEEECDDPECECHHHHDEHEHHHHDHECDDPHCECHHHDHEHEHHHHADEVFVSFGAETTKKYGREELEGILASLTNEKYGLVLRAKGIVECKCGKWLHFDYVPGEGDVREGSAAIIGRLCVIGSKLDRHALEELFGTELK